MLSPRNLSRVLAVVVAIIGLTLMGSAPSYAGDTSKACEINDTEQSLAAFDDGNCCACSGESPNVQCMAVQHQGVVSCTIEFCSEWECEWIEGEES